MNRYLLDTNIVSELRKTRPHGAVVAWIQELNENQMFLSSVTVGELQAGVELTKRQDPHKAAEIESWIDRLEESYRVLPMNSSCFREWARLMAGKPEELIEDVMIAAMALLRCRSAAGLAWCFRRQIRFRPCPSTTTSLPV